MAGRTLEEMRAPFASVAPERIPEKVRDVVSDSARVKEELLTGVAPTAVVPQAGKRHSRLVEVERELFDHEREMLALFKELLREAGVTASHDDPELDAAAAEAANPVLLPFPEGDAYLDRFLVNVMFARKFDLARSFDLLANNTAWRRKWGAAGPKGFPEFDATIRKVNADLTWMYSIPGCRAKNGGSIIYLELGNWIPKEAKFTGAEWVEFNKWTASRGFAFEGADSSRNGFNIVEDLKGTKPKNMGFGTDFTKKEIQDCVNSLSENFPQRIAGIYIINAPSWVGWMIKLAKKLGVSKKVMARIKVLPKPEDLLDYIDRDQLVESHGGTVPNDPGRRLQQQLGLEWWQEARKDRGESTEIDGDVGAGAEEEAASASASAEGKDEDTEER